MKIKKTFTAKIALGFREQYSEKIHSIDEARIICHQYCNLIGLCVTLTPTEFIYTSLITDVAKVCNGEPGCFIEFVNYPRFPSSKYDITYCAIELAKIFLKEFNQNRISIITTEQTYMLEKDVDFKEKA
jgi:hypothetical protein